ncbi:MAG: RadC family protein [Thermoanaerobaculia bacterium]
MTDIICDLPIDERPRERLMMHGAETLSNTELIAILLGSGLHGKNAIELAREMLREGMAHLRTLNVKQLEQFPGIGPAKISRVCAAFELARRIQSDEPEEPPPYDTASVGRKLITACAHLRQERMGAVFLDSRQRILKQREIYVGTLTKALVSTRDIITSALLHNAAGVVVYHNHPSGSPIPSKEDKEFTAKLQVSLRHCDVDLIDHLIIGAHGYYSMKEKGLLGEPPPS